MAERGNILVLGFVSYSMGGGVAVVELERGLEGDRCWDAVEASLVSPRGVEEPLRESSS